MIVADASSVLEVLRHTHDGEAIEATLFGIGQSLHAPHLIDVEVVQVIRRFVASGDIKEDRARAMIEDLAGIGIRRYPHDVLLPRVWELRGNLSAYDAVYVALAEMLDAPLLTRDRRLADAAARYAHIQLI